MTKKLLLGLSFIFAASGLYAASNAGVTSMPFLKLDIGARASAMGGAYTAIAGDIYGMRYNPAGLGLVQSTELSALARTGVANTKTQFVGAAMPLPLAALSGYSVPVIGVNALFSDNGKMDWFATNADGSARYSGVSRNAGGDMALSVGMGERVMSSDLGGALTVEHSVGFAGKYLRSTLPNSDGREVSATAYAADAGYLARMPSLGVDVGVALLNMGGQIKYLDAEEDLPAILRAGVAYDNVRFWRSRMVFTADAVNYMREKETSIRAGAEYTYDNMASLRLGYRYLPDNSGLSMGAGINALGWFFDVGMELNAEFENVLQFAVTYRFPVGKTRRERSARPVILDVKKEQPDVASQEEKAARSKKPLWFAPREQKPDAKMLDDFLLIK